MTPGSGAWCASIFYLHTGMYFCRPARSIRAQALRCVFKFQASGWMSCTKRNERKAPVHAYHTHANARLVCIGKATLERARSLGAHPYSLFVEGVHNFCGHPRSTRGRAVAGVVGCSFSFFAHRLVYSHRSTTNIRWLDRGVGRTTRTTQLLGRSVRIYTLYFLY
ncbi:hypothetical protein B0H12DRAFT_167056 [Mycena haematopus]|nr:hypothetical protein B0H12DRAFT_167056 [Mycena haematopus]